MFMKRVLHYSASKWREAISWYVLLLLPILGTVVFNIKPLIDTFATSFCNTQGHFIGLINYKIMFTDTEYLSSFFNTFYMGVLRIIIDIPLSFTIALFINSIVKGKYFFKVVNLLPMLSSAIAMSIVFKFMFYPNESGIVNYVLSFIGAGPYEWFNSPATARETVVITTLWRRLGYHIVIFTAGLQVVNPNYYHAATIDGANDFQKLRYITIPCIRNTFMFVYITSSIEMWKRFGDVYTIGGMYGNPAGSLMTIMTYIYRKTFANVISGDIGVASSASVVLFFIIIIITYFNLRRSEDRQ